MSTRRSNNKDIQAVLDYAVKNGFVVCKSSGHIKIKLNKIVLKISSSATCPYAHLNARKDVDRILKEQQNG